MISQAYVPDDGIWDQFGAAAATLAPEPGCGRCGHCRERHIPPPSLEPPHSAGAWATDIPLSTALAGLLDNCPSAPRVAVLTDDEPAARVGSIAPLLWEAGVRYFAGVRDWRPRETRRWVFIDDTLDYPSQAPPVPGFVLPRSDALASDWWLVPARPPAGRARPTGAAHPSGPARRPDRQPGRRCRAGHPARPHR